MMRTIRNRDTRRVAAVRIAALCLCVSVVAAGSLADDVQAGGALDVIRGRVFQDYNSNGTFDTTVAFGVATDIGVAGITVRAYDEEGRRVDTTVSDSDGNYVLDLYDTDADDFRIEFTIPAGDRVLSAYRSSFAGTNSGTSIQFAQRGDIAVDYGINVPGEFCQSNPNIAVSRQCLGEDDEGNELEVGALDVDDAPSLWVTGYDGGPYTTATVNALPACPLGGPNYIEGDCDPWPTRIYADVYVNWGATTAALHGTTKSIHGIAWDRRSGRIITSAFVRRNAQMYEQNGKALPGALFTTRPNGTTGSSTGGSSSQFLVDLESLLAGDQFSNTTRPPDGVANAGFTGYIPTNAERKVPGGVSTDDPGAIDSDIPEDSDGVFEEAGKAGIGEIDADDEGNLYVVSLYSKEAYRVVLPANGDTPTSMSSIGSIVQGVACTKGEARPFGVEIWRGSAYFGVVCDGSGDYESTAPNAPADDRNLTFTIRRYDIAAGTWSKLLGPIPLYGANAGDLVKGSPVNDPDNTIPTWGETARWNPWTDDFPYIVTDDQGTPDPDDDVTVPAWERGGWSPVRPVPLLSDIEFDRDGSIILGFRDRSTDQGSAGYRYPDGTIGRINGLNTGDIKRMCLVSGTYVFEGAAGCPVSYPNATAFTATDDEFYLDNYLEAGHADTSAGMTEYVPGFNDVLMTGIDPYSHPDGVGSPADYSAGGVKWMLNSNGGIQTGVNNGGGVLFYTHPDVAANNLGSFNKTNGMGDVEALCDQAPLQIGNRIWNDLDGDGIQDAGEPPLAGVTVNLYNQAGVRVGTAVTDANGEYYFVSTLGDLNTPGADSNITDSVGGGLQPGVPFTVKIDNPADYERGGPLHGLSLTKSNGSDPWRGGSDRIDSDATTQGRYPSMTVGALGPGENDHDFDAGFQYQRVRPSGSGGSSGSGRRVPVIDSDMPEVR